jgi:hypothetical protein
MKFLYFVFCMKRKHGRNIRSHGQSVFLLVSAQKLITITPWPESARELYRPSDRRLSAKLVPTFTDRGSHVVSVTDPYGRILGFLDRPRN